MLLYVMTGGAKTEVGYTLRGALPSSTHKLARVVLEFAIVKRQKSQSELVEYSTAVSAVRVDRCVRGLFSRSSQLL